ncbi:hypothetical protein KGM_212809 [Danaus plexippus plexippus]|uniref:Uncharacterized protein n=1 Tax=Danaus plexippus plexippus TaxID=278856 RepID=A0A212F6D1_DANPL|nr:hypothetical protein KGM_212809 [Danaus plexippus plexippus]
MRAGLAADRALI